MTAAMSARSPARVHVAVASKHPREKMPADPSMRRRVYTSRLLKGGALVHEMRTLIVSWDGSAGCADRLVQENVLSHRSRARSREVIDLVFIPRFVRSKPPDLWKALAILERASWPLQSLLPIHFYAAACVDPLMWDFVEHGLSDRHSRGLIDVGVGDVLRFLEKAPAERFPAGRWGEAVRVRVARGLLAALRDFGLLSGAVKKRLTPVYLPIETFAFLAFTRHLAGVPGSAALTDPCWSLFQLGDAAVERCFVEAHQRHLLGYHAAGSVRRIDFPAVTLADYADALAKRPD